jgi:hypothetical protein
MTDVSLLNTTSQLSGKTVVTREGDWIVTGNWTFDNDPGAPFLVSSSSAVVTNLDADLLDGIQGAAYLRSDTADAMTGVLTMGDSTAADFQINFTTDVQTYYVGTDDSADELVIGLGTGMGTTPAIRVDTNQNVTISQDLFVSGVGPHAIGGAAVDYVRLGLRGAFTSGGASTVAYGTYTNGAITGHSADSDAIVGVKLNNTVVTAGNCTTIAQLWVSEPQITVGSGSVTNSASLYVAGAATEATNDYAFWVDSGVSRFDSNVGIGTGTVAVGAQLEVSTADGAVGNGIRLTNTAGGQSWEFIPGIVGGDETSLSIRNITSTSTLFVLDTGGTVFLNDSTNANMTIGLTVNQGGADNQAFCLKSSDVATGLTTGTLVHDVETDDYFTIGKGGAGNGGVTMQIMAEDAANTPIFKMHVFGGTASTAKTTGAEGLWNVYIAEHDGANAPANIAANGNIFTLQAHVGGSRTTRFMVDEDGDMYSVTTGQTFDQHDDEALVKAYDVCRNEALREEFREFAEEFEPQLVELGILGAPVAEGGMVCVTQLQRLHNGAIRRQTHRIMELEGRVQEMERLLLPAPQGGGSLNA